jgi:hypothetical protein
VLSSETPSFTAFANVIMLFSSVRLGVPNAFYKFVFFTGLGGVTSAGTPLLPRDEQYTSTVVLRNTRYGDIFDPSQTQQPIYLSDDFSLFENDLIPFFDNDTFPVVNAFPLAFLKPRQLAIARTLFQRTAIPFFSRVDRQFDRGNVPKSISVQFDGGPAQTAPVDADGVLRITGLQAAGGLHTLALGPLEAAAEATSFRLLSQS